MRYLCQRGHFGNPRPFQAGNPADGCEEPVAGPGEAHGDHEPAPDAEPQAPVHVERPLSACDEPGDRHPEPSDDHDHWQESEAHRGGSRPELTSL
ncbi:MULTISPECIES: hypothetical protein [Brevibacterium]|uniref:Uncharacterized protein n=1 Tax=Brevibacterium ravenspurgense TaxID=479117 RepID=A0A150HBE6_9MICO|nr:MULTISPECIES: hypothetical protein [Brevibacterium]KXZ59447.1 hypothetical protein Bravens_00381 [Brevibacterium ravenspurgense]OFL67159.1 hypothetical protein HMPREF2757_10670 [Brevibacterium sp. HMSC063G07]OFS26315.1 hypothetical protein HMPREF3162_06865 [Brevibacterium sp. HMSC07C04]